jgi:hypothetical protein
MGNCACVESTPQVTSPAADAQIESATASFCFASADSEGVTLGPSKPKRSINLSMAKLEAGMIRPAWDVSDAEVALAIHEERLPAEPQAASEAVLLTILEEEAPVVETASALVSPRVMRAAPAMPSQHSHRDDWPRQSGGESGTVLGSALSDGVTENLSALEMALKNVKHCSAQVCTRPPFRAGVRPVANGWSVVPTDHHLKATIQNIPSTPLS